MDISNKNETPGMSRPTWQRRALGKVFNRNVAAKAFAIGLVVDQCGYAGKYGGAFLDATEFTRPAAPYYRGFGAVMNFGWQSLKELGQGIHAIVQQHRSP